MKAAAAERDRRQINIERLLAEASRQNSPGAAAALRSAQVEMLRSSQWQSPYFWAAFVLQGEWK